MTVLSLHLAAQPPQDATPHVGKSPREARILAHLEMARRIAKRVARRLPRSISVDDLIAAAMIGLTEAADRFDETRGEPFVAFAEKRIRGAVLDELRRADFLSRRNRVTASRVRAVIERLEHVTGRRPDELEIAQTLGVSVEYYREHLLMLTQLSFVDVTTCPMASIEDQPEEQTATAELKSKLHRALGELPPRDASLLTLYYLEDKGYAEIGALVGISESRVCQLHGRAIARLREKLEAA